MATIGGPRKRRVRYRTWLEKIWSFLNSALGTTLLVTVIGGYVIRGAVIRLESAQREGELAVAAAQEKGKLASQLRIELVRERDRDSREAFQVIGTFVTTSENLMATEERTWRELTFDPEDRKAVADHEDQQRADYNSADEAWDRARGRFDAVFGALDASDAVPSSWNDTRSSADELQTCIERWFIAAPPRESPVEHPCRPAAAGARQALIRLGGALSASKRRMINDLDDG